MSQSRGGRDSRGGGGRGGRGRGGGGPPSNNSNNWRNSDNSQGENNQSGGYGNGQRGRGGGGQRGHGDNRGGQRGGPRGDGGGPRGQNEIERRFDGPPAPIPSSNPWSNVRAPPAQAAGSAAGPVAEGSTAVKERGPRSEGGPVDRGASRGARVIQNIIRTRQEGVSKTGTSGQPVRLLSNYFNMLNSPTWSLYMYHVDFSPETELTGVRKGLLKVHKNILKGYIFDGTSLFLTNRLHNDETDLFSVNRNDERIRISLKFINIVSPSDGNRIQVLNTLMRKAMECLNLQMVGRNFFDAQAKIMIHEHNLELWPGYLTSIRQHENNILLCAEINHKVMRTDNVLQLIERIINNSRGNYREIVGKTLIGNIVLTDYNNKFYRVDGIDWDAKPSSTFKTKTGSTSFIEYYRTKYNLTIRDPGQPMLISNAKERDIRAGKAETLSLVPELCRLTGITDEMRSNFSLMRVMADHTRIGPAMRVRKLLDFNRRLQNTPASVAVFNEWQMKLDPNLVQITGRQLGPENIVFGKGEARRADSNGDWTSEFRGKNKLYNSEPLARWFIIFVDRMGTEAREFVKILQQSGNGMGFRIDEPIAVPIADDRMNTYTAALDKCLQRDPQMVVAVCPNNRADRYKAIKKKCCVERAIPSQVLLAKTITPKRGARPGSLLSVATKVAIQLNCKLGYAPWSIQLPLSGLMTVGFDVCHDTTDKSKSYGAMVATMNLQTHNKYFSVVSAHKDGQELSNHISLNLIKAIHEYRQVQNALPERIIFYRDGVGEGNLNYVQEHEVVAIQREIRKVYKDAPGPPKFAFIVVNKRINSRFFLSRNNQHENPGPGTVIDSVVTSPEYYDFFLISQCVGQGTVSPTYYNVLTESLGLPPDKIQLLTYKMCHLYYNWTGTTRVPAVCQYAHKLAFLVGMFLHTAPSSQLANKLFFL